MNPFSLKNKKILITGASSGIGRATVIATYKAGAEIWATARNIERLSELDTIIGQNNIHKEIADLTLTESLENLINNLPELDGVVLSAGVNDVYPIKFASRKKIDKIFETNFFAQAELIRLLIKKKKLAESSSIVAISSIGGINTYSIGQAAYGASKAALQSWMKYTAKELAPKVRVNCILPGHIETPMNENLAFSNDQIEEYRKTLPMKRLGLPEDVVNGIIYLLSPASSWITGTSITIDGGATL